MKARHQPTRPTLEELLNLADRAEAPHGLTAAEAARLRSGLRNLAQRPAERRPATLKALRQAVGEVQRLQQAVGRIHRPMLRGGEEICIECSGWDGRRCRGLLAPWPCPTAIAARIDREPPSSAAERTLKQ